MGFAVAGAGAAAPAAADPTTVPCADLSEQFDATGNVTDNWFQDCVPQYGLGKAEFTIVADEDNPATEFPAGFVELTDVPTPDITVTSTSDIQAIKDYYDTFASPDAPIDPDQLVSSDASSQTYIASVVAPVTSIGTATDLPTNVATECATADVTYGGGWVATFAPVDTTFAQTINGEPWNYTITAAPLPTYFFGTITGEGLDPVWCVTDGIHTIKPGDVPGDVPFGEYLFALVWPSPPDVADESVASLGTFGRNAPEAPIVPQLAATGVDATPLAVAGGAFAAFGVLMLGLTRLAGRRRRA